MERDLKVLSKQSDAAIPGAWRSPLGFAPWGPLAITGLPELAGKCFSEHSKDEGSPARQHILLLARVCPHPDSVDIRPSEELLGSGPRNTFKTRHQNLVTHFLLE